MLAISPAFMLSTPQILSHPDLRVVLQRQAIAFLAIEEAEPRAAAIFATQQRYILAQVAEALALESGNTGVPTTRFLDFIDSLGFCSRNTADSFLKECIQYRLAAFVESPHDRRLKPYMVGAHALALVGHWLAIHLSTLDFLDGGNRVQQFQTVPGFLARVHPIAVRKIITSKATLEPEGTFSLFAWMNDGGLVMDKMMATLDVHTAGGERIMTGISTFAQLAEPLRITRNHLSRKMAAAEAEGSVGWVGKRGASKLWVSQGFMAEYEAYQADKLARIDEALSEALRSAEQPALVI